MCKIWTVLAMALSSGAQQFTFDLSGNSGRRPVVHPHRLFGCNVPHYLPGIGAGLEGYSTREGNTSAAVAFASALRSSGCKLLRFPGGTPAQVYFTDTAESGMRSGGRQASAFFKEATVNFTGAAQSCYSPQGPSAWTHGFYPRIADFLSFCADFGFEPLWQLNPTMWLEPSDGKIHAATLTQWIVKRGVNGTTCDSHRISPSLIITADPRYSGSIVVESNLEIAAARSGSVLSGQLKALMRRGIPLPTLYEVGNEDYAHLNYCYAEQWALSTTNDTDRYAFLAASLVNVVRNVTRNAEILVTSFVNGTVLEKMAHYGTPLHNVSQTWHYPFARWPAPPKSDVSAATMNLTDFVGTGVGFRMNNELVSSGMKSWSVGSDSSITTSETSTFRFASKWDPDMISASLGGALQFTRDWGELVFESMEQMAVRHDFESPYFGVAFYNTIYDPNSKSFVWAKAGWQKEPHKTPSELHTMQTTYFEPPLSNSTNPFELSPGNFFENRWVMTPTAVAIGLLSECGVDGAVAVNVTAKSDPGWTNRSGAYRKVGPAVFSCIHNETLVITIINTDPIPHNVNLTAVKRSLPRQEAIITTLQGNLRLDHPSRLISPNTTVEITRVWVGGNPFLGLSVPPYSLHHTRVFLQVTGSESVPD